MSSDTVNWEAIARYLAGESPVEEQAAVQRWLAEHPSDARTITALDDALGRLALGPDAQHGIDVDAALAKVKARRDDGGLRVVRGDAPKQAVRGVPARRAFAWVPVAAAAAVIIAATLIWRGPASRPEAPVTTIAARTLTTPVGGRDSLVLPDGSQVMLGPGSELTIAEGFGQATRRVSLRGEALFSVVHDDTKPFVVEANGAEIRDVGTAFVVHSDAGGVRVAVTEGIVELKSSGASVATTLNAGDAASVSPAGQVVAERGVGADNDLEWTRGRLVFRDTPLNEVAEDLQRWYGVHLDIQDPALRRRPLSATFAGDSIKTVLDVISGALGVTMERRGDTVVVRGMTR
jgi:transmembrane sensor